LEGREHIQNVGAQGNRHAHGGQFQGRSAAADKATLVKSDIDVGGLVLEALSREKIPVTLCDWMYVPQLDEWQLAKAYPSSGRKVPAAGIEESVHRIFVREM
jgi:hypothetical protein